jgi:hypothetical protein
MLKVRSDAEKEHTPKHSIALKKMITRRSWERFNDELFKFSVASLWVTEYSNIDSRSNISVIFFVRVLNEILAIIPQLFLRREFLNQADLGTLTMSSLSFLWLCSWSQRVTILSARDLTPSLFAISLPK